MPANGKVEHCKGKDDLKGAKPEIMNIPEHRIDFHDIGRDDLDSSSNWENLKINKVI